MLTGSSRRLLVPCCAVALAACGSRTAPSPNDSSRDRPVASDAVFPDGLSAFCSGAAKVSVNGTLLSANDAALPVSDLHSARTYLPAVTIPRWRWHL
jgi:hypothetical protein